MGVFRTGDAVKVRQLFGTAITYHADEIQGFTLGQEEHHSVPLMLIYPASSSPMDQRLISLLSRLIG
jgi:hypothetical protein